MNMDKLFRKAFYVDRNGSKRDQDGDKSPRPHIPLNELNREELFRLFSKSADVNLHHYFKDTETKQSNPLLIYCDTMIDTKQLNDFLYIQLRKLLSYPSAGNPSPFSDIPFESQNIYHIVGPDAVENMIQQVFSGNLVLFFEETRELYAFQMANPPQRSPSESNTEISIKGPRDGFTESIDTNVALVRKRLKTPTLGIEYYQLGSRSKTSIALLFMTDITNADLLNEVRTRLEKSKSTECSRVNCLKKDYRMHPIPCFR